MRTILPLVIKGGNFVLLVSAALFWVTCSISVPPPPEELLLSEDRTPSWSPTGDQIVYAHSHLVEENGSCPTGLYVVDTLGEHKKLIYEGIVSSPDWSPTGDKVVFSDGELFLMDITNGTIFQITRLGSTFFPSWCPSGQLIAFDTPYGDPKGANAIWTVLSDGTGLRDISEHGTGEWRDADWSPDCSNLVHYRYVGAGLPEIFTMDSLGQNSERLTSDSINDVSPVWSPDGAKIAWTHNGEIWVMGIDDDNREFLIEGIEPSWGPNGRRIVFSKKQDGRVVLYIIDTEGQGLRQLTAY